MPSYLITGSSRGIGLAIVEDLLNDPKNFVIATARSPGTSKGLQALASKFSKDRLAVVKFDIGDSAKISKVVEETAALLPNGLDYLINNAGVSHQPLTTFEDLDYKLFEEELHYNTVVPIQVLRAFLPLIRKGTEKKVVFVTSELGSIEMGGSLPGLANAYSIGKAALNMLARKWGAVLKSEGITVVIIHPGWVYTDIGDAIDTWISTYAPALLESKLTTAQSAAGCLKVIRETKLEDTTVFFNWDGTKKPW